MIPKIYLAGRMSGLTYDEMNEWRVKANNLLNEYSTVLTHNPCDFYNFEIDKSTYTELEVKKFDLWLVENCDIVLVNLNNPNSVGTAIEVHDAFNHFGKPVIGFGTSENHPWIELCITKKCKTLEDAVIHIRDFYLSNM